MHKKFITNPPHQIRYHKCKSQENIKEIFPYCLNDEDNTLKLRYSKLSKKNSELLLMINKVSSELAKNNNSKKENKNIKSLNSNLHSINSINYQSENYNYCSNSFLNKTTYIPHSLIIENLLLKKQNRKLKNEIQYSDSNLLNSSSYSSLLKVYPNISKSIIEKNKELKLQNINLKNLINELRTNFLSVQAKLMDNITNQKEKIKSLCLHTINVMNCFMENISKNEINKENPCDSNTDFDKNIEDENNNDSKILKNKNNIRKTEYKKKSTSGYFNLIYRNNFKSCNLGSILNDGKKISIKESINGNQKNINTTKKINSGYTGNEKFYEQDKNRNINNESGEVRLSFGSGGKNINCNKKINSQRNKDIISSKSIIEKLMKKSSIQANQQKYMDIKTNFMIRKKTKKQDI